MQPIIAVIIGMTILTSVYNHTNHKSRKPVPAHRTRQMPVSKHPGKKDTLMLNTGYQ